MRRWVTALLAVLALSAGVAWGEGKNAKTDKGCTDASSCCCCAKSCPK